MISRAAASRVLDAQPFARLVGTELVEFEPGLAVLRVAIREELRQQAGLVHGGVLAYLLDNAIAFAAGSMLGARVVSSGLQIEFLAPARAGELFAEAAVLEVNDNRATCRADIFQVAAGGPRRLCAHGRGTVVALT